MARPLALALLLLWIGAVASAQGRPSHVLILGVPFISWSEAAHSDYADKSTLSPSAPAALGMILEYWGDNRRLLSKTRNVPGGWTSTEGRGTLDSIRSYAARGIPLFVQLQITPVAHQAEPTLAALGTLRSSGELSSITSFTQAQYERVQAVRSGLVGFGSGVMGKMASADTLRHWADLLGQPTWQESMLATPRVVVGYDDDRRVVILHDPSFGPAWEVSYDDFEAMWNLFDHYFYAFYPPDSAQRPTHQARSAPYPVRSPSQRAAEAFVFGYALESVGRLADAKARLAAGLGAADVPPGYRHLFLLELGRVAEASGDTATAISDYEQAGTLIPQHHRPWLYLSQLYGKSDRAEWRARAPELQKRAEGLCRDGKMDAGAVRSLPHDFTMMGCASLFPLPGL